MLTAPSPLARLAPPGHPVSALPPPLALARHAIDIVWHERFSKDPGHQWLRNLVSEITRTATGSMRRR